MSSWLVVAVALPGLLTLDARGAEPPTPEAAPKVAVRIVVWPALPLLVAHRMIDKYGPPDEVTADRLVWKPRWPWKRIVVSPAWPNAPLEQTVDYRVPAPMLPILQSFSDALAPDTGRGELAVRSDREELNRLHLNLAHDIITGRRTPDQARAFFFWVFELSVAGKVSPYMDRLLFAPPPAEPAAATRLERF